MFYSTPQLQISLNTDISEHGTILWAKSHVMLRAKGGASVAKHGDLSTMRR
jgi:hypothetical protein